MKQPVFAVLILICCCSLAWSAESSSVPGLFIFGDSIVDCGNNDIYLNSTARADYWPYGIDFYAITGRFTNARTIGDTTAELLGLPLIPCFSNPNTTGAKILRGVNYASAGSGILDTTNSSTIVTPLTAQIRSFADTTLPVLQALIGENTSSFLSDSIFLFNTGGNDFIDHCFGDTPCVLPEFVETLIDKYTQVIEWMYSLGARKFLLFSTEVSGCTPVARSKNNGSCIELYNYASTLLNTKLNLSIDRYQEEMADSHFVFVNLFEIMSAVIDDAAAYGIEVIGEACCRTEAGGSSCLVDADVCSNRSNHLFFDGGHPADVANSIMAKMAFFSNFTSYTYPFNIQRLAAISSTSSFNEAWREKPDPVDAQ
ncbi:unnamed protein product [Victoria cruziana]